MTEILGIKIDNLTKTEIENKIRVFLLKDDYSAIVTLNPEIILFGYKNKDFGNILNKADLNLVDGAGIEYVSLLFGKETIRHRFPGVDLMDFIAKEAHRNKQIIMFFGGREKFSSGKTTAETTGMILKEKYPGLEIVFEQGGEIGDREGKAQVSQSMIDRINNSGAEVLFVALSNPYQEEFISELRDKLKNVKLAIGTGGSINLISGYLKRAPKIMQNLGLEWLWRLFTKKGHIKRVYNAVIKFTFLVFYRTLFPLKKN